MQALSVDETRGGDFLHYSLILFLVSRFAMTWLMGYVRASALLAGLSVLAFALYRQPRYYRCLGTGRHLGLPVTDVPDHLWSGTAGTG